MTIQYVQSKYKVHRGKTGVGTQEYITTDKGPEHCLSIAGLDQSQIKGYRDNYITQEPIMAVKEKIPTDSSTHKIPTTGEGGSDPLETEDLKLIEKTDIILYNGYDGQWSQNLAEVQTNYQWLTGTLPTLTKENPPGFYFLGRKSDDSYRWIPAGQGASVICSTNRGLFGVREELMDISAQLFNVLNFFDQSQAPPTDKDTSIGQNLFSCRPGAQLSQYPRVLLLAVHDALTELSQNFMKCTPIVSQVFDALEFLAVKRDPRQKGREDSIKPSVSRKRRDIFSLFGPSEDYGPIYDVLIKLRDNLIFNHQHLENHATRVRSLEKETLTEKQHIQVLGTLHNSDVYARDLNKASFRNLDNLRYVNAVLKEALEQLQDEAILLASSVHFDATCFSHRFRGVQCAKDVPRVDFSPEGLLTIEYFTEEIILQKRWFYSCLPTRQGLSKKHRHYSVQIAKDTNLLNSGVLIMNQTDPESFSQDYERDLASIEKCFFNPRPMDHVYMNCKEETTLQYTGERGIMEAVVIKPFELKRIEASNFPINVHGKSISLEDVQERHDNVLLDDMYGRVTREAWISALHLPRALVQQKEKAREHEYWTDVGKLSIKYPKLRYYFSISLTVMTLTGLGLIMTCLIKYRVNIFHCCSYIYKCCKPRKPDEMRGTSRSRREDRRESRVLISEDEPQSLRSGFKTSSNKSKRKTDPGSRSRGRSRSRSASRGRRLGNSRSPAPSYSAATSPPTIDSSTQVRDRYSVAYRK